MQVTSCAPGPRMVQSCSSNLRGIARQDTRPAAAKARDSACPGVGGAVSRNCTERLFAPGRSILPSILTGQWSLADGHYNTMVVGTEPFRITPLGGMTSCTPKQAGKLVPSANPRQLLA